MPDDSGPANLQLQRDDGSGPWERVRGWARFKWLAPIGLTVAAVIALLIRYWGQLNQDGASFVPICFAILLCAVLSALPPVVCTVQNVSRRRQMGKLESLRSSPLGNTTCFRTATSAIDSIRLVVDADYALPIFGFFLITFIGFLAILTAYSRPQLFATASVLLGGWQDPGGIVPPGQSPDQDIIAQFERYQMQTFSVVAMAFIGSYIYALGRILDRINNNDLYPVSLYYYVTRVITACTAAAVMRHTISVLGFAADGLLPGQVATDMGPILLLLGFGIGFAPDLFILAMTRKAFRAMKIKGTRNDPDDAAVPNTLPLLMIDDLTREKIDRLNELEIDSAQILSRQNPFLLLPRLPYDLSLLVDWIAQAQLYVLVREDGLQKLRNAYVHSVFDLHTRLADDASRAELCQELGISEARGRGLLSQLDQDPSYLRLREVRDALAPQP